jgi:hypothetical protein
VTSEDYDVFRMESVTDGLWFGTAASLPEALKLIRQHAGDKPAKFLVLDAKTGTKTRYIATREKVEPA